jgi:hypothetical protein
LCLRRKSTRARLNWSLSGIPGYRQLLALARIPGHWAEMKTIEAASATSLNLLTRDGAFAVEFTPALEPRHYAELFELVQDFDSEGVARALIMDAAERWGREVTF